MYPAMDAKSQSSDFMSTWQDIHHLFAGAYLIKNQLGYIFPQNACLFIEVNNLYTRAKNISLKTK